MTGEVARRSRPWSEEDDKELEGTWGVGEIEDICSRLGRTREAVQLRASKIGAKPADGEVVVDAS